MSGKRDLKFVNGTTYHVFNTSIAAETIFAETNSLKRFLFLLNFYRYDPDLRFSKFDLLSDDAKADFLKKVESKKEQIVEIHGFCLMPNHYHLLLTQKTDEGISTYLSKVQNGFAKYYNQQASRKGGVFVRPFKAQDVADADKTKVVLRHIHLASVDAGLVQLDALAEYPWTSYPYYSGEFVDDFVATQRMDALFDSREALLGHTKDLAGFATDRTTFKKLLFC